MIVDREDGAFALDAANGPKFGDMLHWNREDFGVCDASDLHAEEFTEGPGGVVVRSGLRILGAPVLVVEQSVRGAGVGLIHANDIAAGGKVASGWRRGFWFLLGLARLAWLLFFLYGESHLECAGSPGNLDLLLQHDAQEVGLHAGAGIVGG